MTQKQLHSFNFAKRPEIINTDMVASGSKALDLHPVYGILLLHVGVMEKA
jgi:hypothetical protein